VLIQPWYNFSQTVTYNNKCIFAHRHEVHNTKTHILHNAAY